MVNSDALSLLLSSERRASGGGHRYPGDRCGMRKRRYPRRVRLGKHHASTAPGIGVGAANRPKCAPEATSVRSNPYITRHHSEEEKAPREGKQDASSLVTLMLDIWIR